MKVLQWLAAACISAVAVLPVNPVHAEGTSASIVDFAAGNYLLSDGTLWTQNADGYGYKKLKYKLTELEGDYGITTDGDLLNINAYEGPKLLKSPAGVVQISGSFYLNREGVLMDASGESSAKYSNVKLFSDTGNGRVLLTRSGELLASHGMDVQIAKFDNPGEIVSVDGVPDSYLGVTQAAAVMQSGKVLLYDVYNIKDNDPTNDLPITVTENAADAKFDNRGNLVVLLKDGTVWTTEGSFNHLDHAIPGLSGVKSLLAVYIQGMYYTAQDGSVWSYDTDAERSEKLELPAITDLSFQLNSTELKVGDTVSVKINETWPDGSVVRLPLADANVDIEKPSLLQMQADGSLKGLAVGVTKVTVTSGSFTKTLEVSVSAKSPVTAGAMVGGTMYFPVQAVFQQMGGSVQYDTAAKIFRIRLDDLPVQLQLGSDTAVVNGQSVKMSGKVQTVDGVKMFPAALLKTAFGADLKWDTATQSMTVLFGKAKMLVETKETLVIKKNKAIGGLSKLIGKTYWINRYDNRYRFEKMTIVDVIPDYNGSFSFVCKLSSGKLLQSSKMTSSELIAELSDSSEFLTADPYKTYKWSNSVWNKIKAGTVSVGMTKQQVEFSWGKPIGTAVMEGGGIIAETWEYKGYNYVSFKNGLVYMVYTS